MSNFQERVRDLCKEVLGKVPIKEEVNVRKLFPQYEEGNHHYDLVIFQYNLIVECHGEQHRTIQLFGSSDKNPHEKLIAQKRRDRRKEQIALENGWSYAILWYAELPKNKEKALFYVAKKIKEAFEN